MKCLGGGKVAKSVIVLDVRNLGQPKVMECQRVRDKVTLDHREQDKVTLGQRVQDKVTLDYRAK